MPKGRVRTALPDLRGREVQIDDMRFYDALTPTPWARVELTVDGLEYSIRRSGVRDEFDVMRWLMRLRDREKPNAKTETEGAGGAEPS